MKNDLRLPLRMAGLLALGLLACANRGMHTVPVDALPGTGGSPGDAGTGGAGATDGSTLDGRGTDGGSGGADGGTGGAGGGLDTCGADAGTGADAAVDAADAGTCNALFNFESPAGCALYGASVNNTREDDGGVDPNLAAFDSVSHSSNAFCGSGSLAIAANFTAAKLGGEILIPVPQAQQNFTGKTLTLWVKASPGGTSNTRFEVFVVSRAGNAGYVPTFTAVHPFPSVWTKETFTFPASGADAGADAAAAPDVSQVFEISIQGHGATDIYAGTIYVDEIDIR
jgi:hypothetical protein